MLVVGFGLFLQLIRCSGFCDVYGGLKSIANN